MRYTINSDEKIPLDICENDKVRSVLQNVALILSTKKGTCPMYRDFGIPMAWVHRPLAAAEALAAAEVAEALAAFEPRATFVDLSLIFDRENCGKYKLLLEVEI